MIEVIFLICVKHTVFISSDDIIVITFPRRCFGTGGFVGFGGLKVGRGVLVVVEGGVLIVVVLVATNTLPFVTR